MKRISFEHDLKKLNKIIAEICNKNTWESKRKDICSHAYQNMETQIMISVLFMEKKTSEAVTRMKYTHHNHINSASDLQVDFLSIQSFRQYLPPNCHYSLPCTSLLHKISAQISMYIHALWSGPTVFHCQSNNNMTGLILKSIADTWHVTVFNSVNVKLYFRWCHFLEKVHLVNPFFWTHSFNKINIKTCIQPCIQSEIYIKINTNFLGL